MKTCSKCGELKTLSEFNRDKSRLDGREYVCRQCKKSRAAEYISKNKKRIKRYSVEWYAQNKERVKDYGARYRKENKNIVAEKDAGS